MALKWRKYGRQARNYDSGCGVCMHSVEAPTAADWAVERSRRAGAGKHDDNLSASSLLGPT